jgi:hypothetical protein
MQIDSRGKASWENWSVISCAWMIAFAPALHAAFNCQPNLNLPIVYGHPDVPQHVCTLAEMRDYCS